MVRYVVLRRFLHSVPPKISFRNVNANVPAWLTPRRGHLRSVKFPDSTVRKPMSNNNQSLYDTVHTVFDGDGLESDMNDGNDWTESIDDAENNDEFPENVKNSHQLANSNQTTPQPDTGHIKLGQSRPSDTCPHTCKVMCQNVNGLGTTSDDKLEKIVALMIDRKLNAYCLQETRQLGDYMTTIRGYTVFHHGMKEKPQRQGRTSAGVMIILCPELARAWTRAGKLEPITSSIDSKFPGQMIGLTLCFPNKSNRSTDTYHRKAKGVIKLFYVLFIIRTTSMNKKSFTTNLINLYPIDRGTRKSSWARTSIAMSALRRNDFVTLWDRME